MLSGAIPALIARDAFVGARLEAGMPSVAAGWDRKTSASLRGQPKVALSSDNLCQATTIYTRELGAFFTLGRCDCDATRRRQVSEPQPCT